MVWGAEWPGGSPNLLSLGSFIQDRMKVQVAVLLAMGLVGIAAWKSKTLQHSEFMETCDFEKLDGPDSEFCQ